MEFFTALFFIIVLVLVGKTIQAGKRSAQDFKRKLRLDPELLERMRQARERLEHGGSLGESLSGAERLAAQALESLEQRFDSPPPTPEILEPEVLDPGRVDPHPASPLDSPPADLPVEGAPATVSSLEDELPEPSDESLRPSPELEGSRAPEADSGPLPPLGDPLERARELFAEGIPGFESQEEFRRSHQGERVHWRARVDRVDPPPPGRSDGEARIVALVETEGLRPLRIDLKMASAPVLERAQEIEFEGVLVECDPYLRSFTLDRVSLLG